METKNTGKYTVHTKCLFLFMVCILLCIVIPRFLVPGSSHLFVHVRNSGEPHPVFLRRSTSLQILCLGPLFGVIFFFLMKAMLKTVDIVENRRNRGRVFLLEGLTVFLVGLSSIGHTAHLLFNDVNAIDKSRGVLSWGTVHNVNLDQLFLLSYWADEWLGHTLSHLPLFGFLLLAVVAEELTTNNASRPWKETLLVGVVGGVGVMVMDGAVAIASECGILLLSLHLLFVVPVIPWLVLKKINPLKRSFLFAMLVGTLLLAAYNGHFIFRNGLKDFYPYYSANLSH